METNQNTLPLNEGVLQSSCSYCNGVAFIVCDRCNDFYCSPDCQRKDWPSHRYICFRIPPLVSAAVKFGHAPAPNDKSNKSKMLGEANYPESRAAPSYREIKNSNDNIASKIQTHHTCPKEEKRPQLQQEKTFNIPERKEANSKKQQNTNKQLYPNLVLSSTRSKIPISQAALPKSNSRVKLTGFRSSNRCGIRSEDDDEDFYQNAKKIDSFGQFAPFLSSAPEINSYAIAPYNGKMYRVQILKLRSKALYTVLFCDIGNTCTKNLCDLRRIDDEIVGLKFHVSIVQIRNARSIGYDNKVINYLKSFEGKYFKIVYNSDDSKYNPNGFAVVDLYKWDTTQSLSTDINRFINELEDANSTLNSTLNSPEPSGKIETEQLRDKQYYASGESETGSNRTVTQRNENGMKKTQKPLKSNETKQLPKVIEMIKFPIGDTSLEAIVVDTSSLKHGYVACVLKSDVPKLLSVQNYLSKYEPTPQIYIPKLAEYCLAKYDGEWYRAKVLKIDNEEYTVTYIDFTNEGIVSLEDIQRYPSDLEQNCVSNVCSISGLPTSLTKIQEDYIKKQIKNANSMLIIDKVTKWDDDFITIECSELIRKMRADGLIH